jgi:hypothetical protein
MSSATLIVLTAIMVSFWNFCVVSVFWAGRERPRGYLGYERTRDTRIAQAASVCV